MMTERRLLLITGMAGSGRTTVLKHLEDLGYEAVDNLPLDLLGPLMTLKSDNLDVVVAIDTRSRGFDAEAMVAEIEKLRGQPDLRVDLIYVDADNVAIGQRYSETRRRHPVAPDRPVMDGIREERRMLEPLRSASDHIFDTSNLTANDLKRLISETFTRERASNLTLVLQSFGFKNGLPREADMVFDMRFLKNPYYDPALRIQTGLDQAVADYVSADDRFQVMLDKIDDMLQFMLPAWRQENRSYATIAIGCTGGQHRSVFTTASLAKRAQSWADQESFTLVVRHRDKDQAVAKALKAHQQDIAEPSQR